LFSELVLGALAASKLCLVAFFAQPYLAFSAIARFALETALGGWIAIPPHLVISPGICFYV
jgi:hypothetical protein